MKKLTAIIKAQLKENYNVTGKTADRYAKLLIVRAVTRSLDELDTPTVSEDLYEEDGELVNLDYAEQTEIPRMLKDAMRGL